MSSGFFTDKDRRVRPLTPTISSFFGSAVSDVENAARKDLLRKEMAAKKQRRIARTGVDPNSLGKNSLNSYVEAARVKGLDDFASLPVVDVIASPRYYHEDGETLLLSGDYKNYGVSRLSELDVRAIARQVISQKYRVEDREGWKTAITFLSSKLTEMTDQELVSLANERMQDDDRRPEMVVLDYFTVRELRKRRKPVYSMYGRPLSGMKRAQRIKPKDQIIADIDNATLTLGYRVSDYIRDEDPSFVKDVKVPAEKPKEPQKSKYKSIAVFEQ